MRGNPFDGDKDFNTETGYFCYLDKVTYGDGAAAEDFDDCSWLKLDLPHDWALAWLLKNDRITAVLIGASAVEQLQNNIDLLVDVDCTNAELDKTKSI